VLPASFSYSVGSGGAAQTAGGDTTANDGSITITAGGGQPGIGTGFGGIEETSGFQTLPGGAGGSATNGSLNIPGEPGAQSIYGVAGEGSGKGGSSCFGAGGRPVTGDSNGNAALGYGAGGSGASSNTAGVNETGGSGTAGLFAVIELG
jgi:hypothetical protein